MFTLEAVVISTLVFGEEEYQEWYRRGKVAFGICFHNYFLRFLPTQQLLENTGIYWHCTEPLPPHSSLALICPCSITAYTFPSPGLPFSILSSLHRQL